MKPVWEATSEAMNIIKEIGPDSDNDKSVSRWARNERGNRPWQQTKGKATEPTIDIWEPSESQSICSSAIPEDDKPEKKVSTATKKRREAIKQEN